MFEGSYYLAVSALGITLLTALAFLAVGIIVGWVLWRRPCAICEEQLLRARTQLEDMDALERENLELRQKLTKSAEGDASNVGEEWDPLGEASNKP
jgi:hypothetical protein